LPHASRVSLKVYNTLGQEVATLANEMKPAGVYTVQFDAGSVASGVYFYGIQAGDFVQTKKMLVVK
jgi:Secretion system C-terminal sorting domain